MTFRCSHCGKDHDSLPEPSYQRPDDVWSLAPPERAHRVVGGDDFCVLSGVDSQEASRHFVRGIIPLPIVGVDDTWALVVWVEVAEADFERYKHLYNEDASSESAFPGVVANAPKCFEDALGADVMIRLRTATQRPTFWFAVEATNPLAERQRTGITLEQIHQVVG